MVPNQENMGDDQQVQSHINSQQPLQPQTCVQEHCPGETGFPSSVFQAIHETVSSTTLQSPELLIQCGGFIWKKIMQLVSGKVEINACQVSVWGDSSLVNPWTFQHTLVWWEVLVVGVIWIHHSTRRSINNYVHVVWHCKRKFQTVWVNTLAVLVQGRFLPWNVYLLISHESNIHA